jgi:hypothetical protein
MHRLSMVVILLLAACGRKEDVRHYKAPKDPVWRMLAAIVPGKDSTWFLKAVGPGDRIGQYKEEVLGFFRGVRFEGAELRWTLPPGWQEEKATPNRQATLRFGDREPRLELSIVRLAGDGGGLPSNVNRWRDQLGLDHASDAEVAALLRKVDGATPDVKVVDLSGPNRPGTGARPMMGKAAETPSLSPSDESPIAFDLPSGWKENPHPGQGRKMEFSVELPEGSALVTLTAFTSDAGGIAANIDRWRTQAGLEPLGDQAVARSATPMTFVGTEGWLVEAMGKDRAILGVIAITPGASLFLKMDGPPAVVRAQQTAFARFAQSFRLRKQHE